MAVATKEKKKFKRVMLDSVDVQMDLDSVIKELQELKEEYEKHGFTDLMIDGYYPQYCEHECLGLFGCRIESDEEYAARMEKEAKYAAIEKAKDEAEFERLKNKLGK